MNCPAPLKPRDFVLMRSWLDTGPGGEAMLISRSVEHKDYPPKKGFIRATSHLTGFVLRPHGPSSCVLSYVTHCDPQGALPPWLVNKVTHTFGPRMIKDMQKAAVGYLQWKTERNLYWKPWRYPEQIDKPRISIEEVGIVFFDVFEVRVRHYLDRLKLKHFEPVLTKYYRFSYLTFIFCDCCFKLTKLK